jgi:hypothetical protein
VICHSATGGVASVAAHLSALLPGIQIEGFIGIVYSAGLELYESSLRIGGLDLYNDDRLLGSFDSDFVYEKYYSSALHRTVIDDFFSKTARRCTLFDPIIAEDSGDSVLFINGKVVSIDV